MIKDFLFRQSCIDSDVVSIWVLRDNIWQNDDNDDDWICDICSRRILSSVF